MTENVKAALAKENKFSCNSWQIDLNSATPNHVSFDKRRGGCIRSRTESMNFTAILVAVRGHQKN